MLPKINKLLYTTDLSPNSEFVLRYALGSAIKHDAKIVVLHVIEMLPQTAQMLLSSYVSEDLHEKISTQHRQHVVERITEKVQELCGKELAEWPDADELVEDILTREGYPAEVILKMVDELNCDLIVMGNHGKGAISQTFLGSVSKRVLRRSHKPVFIIPLPKDVG
jgi:nucleotide-binding universal stress UspA family protein